MKLAVPDLSQLVAGLRDVGVTRLASLPMRAVVQRVSSASVVSEGVEVGAIGAGLAVLVGVASGDGVSDAVALANKIIGLRIFSDSAGKMNLSVLDVKGAVLVVSQFTLYGDSRKGRRPSFGRAAPPEEAEALIETFCDRLKDRGAHVETGRFRTTMEVRLVNEGPVTLILETADGQLV